MRNRLSRLWIMVLLAASLTPLSAIPIARADSGDSAAILQQMKELKQMMRELGTRMHALENKQKTTKAAPTSGLSPQEHAAIQEQRRTTSARKNWGGVNSGLSQAQVLKLLGQPQRHFELSNRQVWYYYYPSVGGGSVFFNHEGKVIGRQAPPFNAFGFF